MFSRRDLSFDGKLFFLYDREAVTSEADPPENAIIYFYPSSATIESRISICGQLVGMSNFLTTVMDFAPVLINLKTEKVALCESGQYTLALGGTMSEPETLLLKQLQTLFDIFVFYHGSLDTVRQLSKDHETFLTNMSIIWDCYLHFVRHYGDTLPAVFNPLPFLKTPKNSSGCFLKASHILQACQRRHHIIGGCILHQKNVLCTQLETSITRRLLLLKPNQSHHPGKQVKTDIKLPFGVRFLESFITCCEYNQLIKALQKSPYHSTIKSQKIRPSHRPVSPQKTKGETTVNESVKERTSQSERKQNPGLSARENVQTTTRKAAQENMDLEFTSKAKKHSMDQVQVVDVKDLSEVTSAECDKENSNKQSTRSRSLKHNKTTKQCPTMERNGKMARNDEKGQTRTSCERESLNGEQLDEVNENRLCTNDDFSSDCNTEKPNKNVNDCDRETQEDDALIDKELLLCGTELTMDEIVISGLHIVDDNNKSPIRDFTEQGINGQEFPDSSGDITSGRITNDDGVMSDRIIDTSGDVNGQGTMDQSIVDTFKTENDNGAVHENLDPSRTINEQSDPSPNINGLSTDVNINGRLTTHNESVQHYEDVLTVDGCVLTGNSNCVQSCNDVLDEEIRVSRTEESEEPIQDNLNCPQEDSIIEEKLPSSSDGFHGNETDEDDCQCDSGRRDHVPETSHQPLSPPIDLPGLHNHGNQASGVHNSPEDTLNSPTEEFHDTVEELEGNIKFTPNTVGAYLNSYHDLKSNALMAGKYSSLNVNQPEDKKIEKSFFKDLINPDKLACYTTHNINGQYSEDTTSRSSSSSPHGVESSRSGTTGRESVLSDRTSSSQGKESNRSDRTGRESGLSNTTSLSQGEVDSNTSDRTGQESSLSQRTASESPTSHQSKLGDSGLCLFHGSSEGSLSQTDGNVDSPDLKQSPVDFLSEKSSNSTTDLEMSCSTVCDDVEELQKEQAEYVDDFDENLYQIDGLVHINLYVQAHSNTVLILLADSSLSQDQETIKALWKTTLNELGELEVQLNQFCKTKSEHFDKLDDYNFVLYDSISSTTKGNLSEPVEQVDFKFCDTAKTVHEQFNNCASLKSVTLRDHSSAIHCQRSLDQEVYFHRKSSLNPFRGSPSHRDSSFTIERRAPKHLKNHYGVNII